MLAVFKREIKRYYTSLITYIYYALFMLACGILFSVYCLASYNSQFGYYVISKAFYICVFMLPLFTMQMFAGEKHRRTDQLLFTAPVSYYSIVLAKFLSVVIVALLPVVISFVYPFIILGHCDINIRFLACSYIAVFLGVLVITALGMFISAITSNPILAAIIMYGVYVLLVLFRLFESISGQGGLYYFLNSISLYDIYLDMVSGIVRTGNIIYVIVLILLFTNLTWLKLIFDRINIVKKIMATVLMVVTALVVSIAFSVGSVTKDYTPEGLLTLSPQTVKILNGINKETKIFYIGRISNANATYREFLNLYESQSDFISVEYVDLDENSSIMTNYMNGITMINEASILVLCEDKYIYLDSDKYISTIQESDNEYRSVLEIENQLTEAIYYTNNPTEQKIYMLDGNMEPAFTENIENKLKQKGYNIKYTAIDNNSPSDLSSGCDLLIMNSPEEDYSDDEIEYLSSYIDNGGKLLAFIDPLNEEMPNLYSFFESYGLTIETGVVIEKDESRYAYDTPYYLAPEIKEHEITNVLLESNLPIYTMTSKGIRVEDSNSDMQRTDLLLTSRRAFSKKSDFDNMTDKGADDVGGPFSVASLVKKGEGELLLVTSNIFLNDEVDEDSLGANSKFLIGMINYMTGSGNEVNIAGKDVKYNVALYQRSFVRTMKLLGIVIIPLLIILIGIAVVLIRNNNILIKYMYGRKRISENSTMENAALNEDRGKEQL